jgi:hypothetical protein
MPQSRFPGARAPVLKTADRRKAVRGFKSHPRRLTREPVAGLLLSRPRPPGISAAKKGPRPRRSPQAAQSAAAPRDSYRLATVVNRNPAGELRRVSGRDSAYRGAVTQWSARRYSLIDGSVKTQTGLSDAPSRRAKLDRNRQRLRRQLEGEGRSLAGLRLDPDAPVHRPDELTADVQA